MTEAAFRLVRKGYEPAEVEQRVSQLQSTIERLQSDLGRAHEDNAAQAVENTKQRQQLVDLSGRIEMLEQTLAEVRTERDSGVPPTFGNLGERIGQMLTLAQDEADELRATARTEADELTASCAQQVAELAQNAERDAAEVLSRAKAEAARALESARQQADSVREEADAEATARREEAEAVYEAQRAQAAAASADFEQTLARRRTEAMDELNAALEARTGEVQMANDQLERARSEAERVATEAADRAEQIVRDAQTEATSLLSNAKRRAEGIRQNSERELAAATARRDSITAQLSNVRQMLATLGGPQVGLSDGLPRTAQAWASESDAPVDASEQPEVAVEADPDEADQSDQADPVEVDQSDAAEQV